MSDMPKRTQKDETEYDEQCRRENSVYRDLVIALRKEVKMLRVNQAALFAELIHTEDSLRVYRVQHSDQSNRYAELGDNMPGFYWDTADGWHRESERNSK